MSSAYLLLEKIGLSSEPLVKMLLNWHCAQSKMNKISLHGLPKIYLGVYKSPSKEEIF